MYHIFSWAKKVELSILLASVFPHIRLVTIVTPATDFPLTFSSHLLMLKGLVDVKYGGSWCIYVALVAQKTQLQRMIYALNVKLP